MITRQVVIPLRKLARFKDGSELALYLRGCGLNLEGNVKRYADIEKEVMVYTEILEGEDERPDTIGEMPEVEVGI